MQTMVHEQCLRISHNRLYHDREVSLHSSASGKEKGAPAEASAPSFLF